MEIYTGNKPLKLRDKPDRDGLLFYTFFLKPPVWVAGAEYIEGDIIAPSSATGFYYRVVSSGVAGATEPVWSTDKTVSTTDNTVVYKAVNNTAYLSSNQTVVSATIIASDSVPVTNVSFTSAGKVTAQIGAVPAGVSVFTITVQFTVNTGNAANEYDERSIVVSVIER